MINFNRYISLIMLIVVARRRRKDGRTRRQRTTFSNQQTLSLEMEYQRAEYISRSRRCELAQRLSLTETQVKASWLKNILVELK